MGQDILDAHKDTKSSSGVKTPKQLSEISGPGWRKMNEKYASEKQPTLGQGKGKK